MTTNIELDSLAEKLKIKNYKPAICKDQLKGKKVSVNECGIINTGNSDSVGSFHWCCYFKKGDYKVYFDSYGSPILPDIKEYLGDNTLCSSFQIQSFESKECGEYCIILLYLLDNNIPFEDIVLSLVELNDIS